MYCIQIYILIFDSYSQYFMVFTLLWSTQRKCKWMWRRSKQIVYN